MKRAILAIALLGIVLAHASATDVVTKYPSDQTATSGGFDATAADSADLGALSARGIILPQHSKNLTIAVSFSGMTAATVGVVRGRVVGGTFRPNDGDCDWATFTADSTYKTNGHYVSRAATFDTTNVDACEVFVKSVTGSGDLRISWRTH